MRELMLDNVFDIHNVNEIVQTFPFSSKFKSSTLSLGKQRKYKNKDTRIDKLKNHPMVSFIEENGNYVICRCKRTIKLNPPYYINKFVKHIKGRNCGRNIEDTKKTQDDKDKEAIAILENLEQAESERIHRSNHKIIINKKENFGLNEKINKEHIKQQNKAKNYKHKDKLCYLDKRINIISILENNDMVVKYTSDGNNIYCKCGKRIRLNPSWHLAKYYKHLKTQYCINIQNDRNKQTSGLQKSETTIVNDSLQDINTIKDTKRIEICKSGKIFKVSEKFQGNEQDVYYRYGMITNVNEVNIHGDILANTYGTGDIKNQWTDPLTKGIFMPCPGIRTESVMKYVSISTCLTGGYRPIKQIINEYLPSCNKEYAELNEVEKRLIHNAKIKEAKWIIDREGRTVRSTECTGIKLINKSSCDSCVDLSSLPLFCSSVNDLAKGDYLSINNDSIEIIFNELASLWKQHDNQNCGLWTKFADFGIKGLFKNKPYFLGLIYFIYVNNLKEDDDTSYVYMQNNENIEMFRSFLYMMKDSSIQALVVFCENFGCEDAYKDMNILCLNDFNKQTTHITNGAVGNTISKLSNSKPNDTKEVSKEEVDHCNTADSLMALLTASASRLPLSKSMDGYQSNNERCVDDAFQYFLDDSASMSKENERDAISQANPEFKYGWLNLSVVKNLQTIDTKIDQTIIPSEDANNIHIADHILKLPTKVDRPCYGLYGKRFSCYANKSMQIIGGHRPRHIIAMELFPHIFNKNGKVKIMKNLSNDEKMILTDAMYREAIWIIDKQGECIKSSKCHKTCTGSSCCEKCNNLKGIPSFRSVISRANKHIKNYENKKFIPNEFYKTNPFTDKLRKIPKLDSLYKSFKQHDDECSVLKNAFWLKFLKHGLKGSLDSYPCVINLVERAISSLDYNNNVLSNSDHTREKYANYLKNYMSHLANISLEAYNIFLDCFYVNTQAVGSSPPKNQSETVLLNDTLLTNLLQTPLSLRMACPDEHVDENKIPSGMTM